LRLQSPLNRVYGINWLFVKGSSLFNEHLTYLILRLLIIHIKQRLSLLLCKRGHAHFLVAQLVGAQCIVPLHIVIQDASSASSVPALADKSPHAGWEPFQEVRMTQHVQEEARLKTLP
jgi:hypothetical protein